MFLLYHEIIFFFLFDSKIFNQDAIWFRVDDKSRINDTVFRE